MCICNDTGIGSAITRRWNKFSFKQFDVWQSVPVPWGQSRASTSELPCIYIYINLSPYPVLLPVETSNKNKWQKQTSKYQQSCILPRIWPILLMLSYPPPPPPHIHTKSPTTCPPNEHGQCRHLIKAIIYIERCGPAAFCDQHCLCEWWCPLGRSKLIKLTHYLVLGFWHPIKHTCQGHPRTKELVSASKIYMHTFKKRRLLKLKHTVVRRGFICTCIYTCI